MKKISLVLLLGLLPFCTGCQGLLLTTMVLLKGTDIDPKYDFLLKDKKKVVVVCQSRAMDQYRNPTAPRDIGRQVTDLLNINIRNKKLEIVESSKVEEWLDDCDNQLDSYVKFGRSKGIEADYVIAIELQDFRIQDPGSQGLYQGRANVLVKAYDCETGKTIASESLKVLDPPNSQVPADRVSEQAFREQFVSVVSQQAACLFHPYDKNKINRMDAHSIGML